VAEVVAAKGEAADEGGHQSVGGDELGEAVDAEGDRDGRVEPSRSSRKRRSRRRTDPAAAR
jgi:hypothetical protein